MAYEIWWSVQVLAFFSCLIIVVAVANEVIRLYLDGAALSAREDAYNRHQLREYDLPYQQCLLYYVPSTDLPSHPGGIGTGSLWRCLNIVFLIGLFFEEAPIKQFVTKFGRWLRPFSDACGPWFAGWLMLVLGAGMLAVPTGVVGNDFTRVFREIAGWALFVNGGIVLLEGILLGRQARMRRGQIEYSAGGAQDAKLAVKARFKDLKDALGKVHGEHVPLGPLEFALGEMQDAIDALLA